MVHLNPCAMRLMIAQIHNINFFAMFFAAKKNEQSKKKAQKRKADKCGEAAVKRIKLEGL